MSIRTLLALLLASILSVAFAILFFLSRFLEHRIAELLPPSFVAGTSNAIRLLVFEQFSVIVVISVILTALAFFVFSTLIAAPLSRVMKAMGAFAADGARVPVPELPGAPKEIQTLALTFGQLMDRVEAAHQKDTEISRLKSDFISTAAHQLRTPLTGIRWALEALQNEPLNDDQKTLVKSATDKSHDLVSIVGTLLDISSIESGRYKYKMELADIAPIVAEVAQDFSPLAQERNVSLFYARTEENPLPQVRIDRDRIKWILNNLVENAIRYTPVQGTVRLTTDSSAGRVYVRVSDTGIGIKTEDQANIFERFYRAGNAITKENKGNGLGLYIARTIATDHGGDLNFVSNTEGQGTTFALSLPVAGQGVV